MKRMIKMGSIEQFRNIVRNVKHTAQYQGIDSNGDSIMDRDAELPVITAVGTEKIHGTNAAVCFNSQEGFWVQSRKNIITPEKDNAGCAFVAMQNKDKWMDIIHNLANEWNIDLYENIITVYFEWCGGNIQKNACVSGLDKIAIIFKHFKVSPLDDESEEKSVWYETNILPNNQPVAWLNAPESNIYNIMNFPSVSVEIDFNRPDIAQNKMVELVEEVEKKSGVAHTFDKPENIGEGWVFTFEYKDNLFKFKVKGEKHSASKVKKIKKVDSEKEQKKIDFANYATPAWRLEQAWQEVFGIENEKMEPTIKEMGNFLRFVHKDIIKEESDVLGEKGLETKKVNSTVSKIARDWFKEKLDQEYGLK